MTPSPLNGGDTIGIMAPSSYVEREDIERANILIEKRGYKVFIHPQTFEQEHQSAGSHAQKAAAFHELWDREDIKVIWAAGGGNRAFHLLNHINFDNLKGTPKTLVGFSDVTVLLNALYAHTGTPSIHGPVFKNLSAHPQIDTLFSLLSGEGVSMPLEEAHIIQAGTAEAPLIGGNLSLFQYLPRTLPGEFWKNGILFLEDCSEELSRIDRMLLYLKTVGVFEQIKGLVFGQFTDMRESGRPFGYCLQDIIKEHTHNLQIPIIMDAPFGHGTDLYPLPIGITANLNTDENSFKTRRFTQK